MKPEVFLMRRGGVYFECQYFGWTLSDTTFDLLHMTLFLPTGPRSEFIDF